MELDPEIADITYEQFVQLQARAKQKAAEQAERAERAATANAKAESREAFEQVLDAGGRTEDALAAGIAALIASDDPRTFIKSGE